MIDQNAMLDSTRPGMLSFSLYHQCLRHAVSSEGQEAVLCPLPIGRVAGIHRHIVHDMLLGTQTVLS